ncbi:MAG: ComF family protein [Prevotella sp.]|nr:ComF family protein [Prevotella sp.]
MKPSFLTKVLDFVSPRLCVICGRRLLPSQPLLCSHCMLHLPVTDYYLSPLDNPMARLFWGLFPIERASALFFYEPKASTRELIYDLKYRGFPMIGEEMGALIARHYQPAGFFEGVDVIIPVPLTRRRRWQRGYNQSEMLARGIREVTGLPILTDVLKRTSFKGSQTKKNQWERRENVDGVFRLVRPDDIRGKHILLIDDIITTGATIVACADELCKAGDVKISVLSLGLTKA